MTVMMGITAGASLLGAMTGDDAPAPPPVRNPALPAPTARAPGAVVKIGSDDAAGTDDTSGEYKGFAEKRVTGKTLGGLGRGGLGL